MKKQYAVRTIVETTWEHIVDAEDEAGAVREAQRLINEFMDRFGHDKLNYKSRIIGIWLPAGPRDV